MKITLEIENLKVFIDAMNNATHAYVDIVNAIEFGCHVPRKFDPLKELEIEVLKDRVVALQTVYEQLIKIEDNNKTEVI